LRRWSGVKHFLDAVKTSLKDRIRRACPHSYRGGFYGALERSAGENAAIGKLSFLHDNQNAALMANKGDLVCTAHVTFKEVLLALLLFRRKMKLYKHFSPIGQRSHRNRELALYLKTLRQDGSRAV
jgi:hypothetical protein